MFSANDLLESLRSLAPPSIRGFAIALSGGADSCALMAAMIQLRPTLSGYGLRAIHVNHGLQPAAPEFVARCEVLCDRFMLPLIVVNPVIRLTPGRSVEEVAREARYAALGQELRSGECLITAHHEQDQAETFLLQALRGAGVKGLSAMPGRRPLGVGWHLRPLLHVKRAELRAFGSAMHVLELRDSMNEDLRFDRSYLRHAIWPTLESRWPAAAAVLCRSAAHLAQAAHVLAASVCRDLVAARDGNALSIPLMRRLAPQRQLEVLRAFAEEAGIRPPASPKLHEALRQMLQAGVDRMPAIFWSEHALRRYRDRMYLTPANIEPLVPRDWDFRADAVCELGTGLGHLAVRAQAGGLDPARLPAVLQIRPRRGGETIKQDPHAPTRSVRHLCQGRGIVPWMRDSIPFLHADNMLVAVADLWSDARFRCGSAQAGVAFVWESAPPIL